MRWEISKRKETERLGFLMEEKVERTEKESSPERASELQRDYMRLFGSGKRDQSFAENIWERPFFLRHADTSYKVTSGV